MEQDNKITSIKIPSFKVSGKAQIAEIIIRFVCILKEIKLSKTEVFVLAYFLCEGYNEITKEQLLEGKIFQSKGGLSNMLSRFRKLGILRKKGFKECITEDFDYQITDKLLFSIMMDNS